MNLRLVCCYDVVMFGALYVIHDFMFRKNEYNKLNSSEVKK